MSLLAYDSGLSYEKISLLFKKAMDSSSNIGDICVNIQKNLEYEISATKIESGGGGSPLLFWTAEPPLRLLPVAELQLKILPPKKLEKPPQKQAKHQNRNLLQKMNLPFASGELTELGLYKLISSLTIKKLYSLTYLKR